MKGTPASPGIAIAVAYIIDEPEINISHSKIETQEISREICAFNAAIEKSKQQLQYIYDITVKNVGEKEAEIIQAHMVLIEDPMLAEEITKKVSEELYNVLWAVSSTINEQVVLFESIEDPYIRERAADLKDIGQRIIKNILGMPFKDVSILAENVILVGRDITPALLATADRKHVKGIISETGGPTSHTAILARNMDIPAVLGVSGILQNIKDGQAISVDGSLGIIDADIDNVKLCQIQKKIEAQNETKKKLKELIHESSTTSDGYAVELASNIGKPEDTVKAMENGAEGVGLFRTEFLYMDRASMPNEEEQYEAYRQALLGMEGRSVIIRTMDAGGDKEIDYLCLPKESNPFLGYRAIRICLERQDIFKTQLRAILRASIHGKARIMYPMISSADEVIAANKVLEEVKSELRAEGIKFDKNIEVGIMIEIPSAAITADIIVKHVDFFSIGTNDLTQYTLAVDRINEKVSYLYNSFNPAVLRLIQNVINESHKAGKFTGMCGELAGNPLASILLLGMGLDEFSMSASSILKIRKIIKAVDIEFAKNVKNKVFSMTNACEIEEYLKTVLTDKGLGYLLQI